MSDFDPCPFDHGDGPCNNCMQCFPRRLAAAEKALAEMKVELRIEKQEHQDTKDEATEIWIRANEAEKALAEEREKTTRLEVETLKRAAKAVDDLDMPEMWDGSIGKTDDGGAFRRDAVAAILALASTQETKE